MVGVGPRGVHLEAVGLRELHDVEPVLRPALAVTGAREGHIYELLPSVFALVPDELVDLLRRRQESVEVQVESPNQGDTICFGRGPELLLSKSREDIGVDG